MTRLKTAEEVRDQHALRSVVTVYRMAADGRLPAVRLSSKAIRFREEDVDAFVEASITRD
jgi:excisionase family DNA binding protein